MWRSCVSDFHKCPTTPKPSFNIHCAGLSPKRPRGPHVLLAGHLYMGTFFCWNPISVTNTRNVLHRFWWYKIWSHLNNGFFPQYGRWISSFQNHGSFEFQWLNPNWQHGNPNIWHRRYKDQLLTNTRKNSRAVVILNKRPVEKATYVNQPVLLKVWNMSCFSLVSSPWSCSHWTRWRAKASTCSSAFFYQGFQQLSWMQFQ